MERGRFFNHFHYSKYSFLLILLFFKIFIHPANSQSPSLQWVTRMGGPGFTGASGYSIAVDIKGNVYTCGVYSGTVDFDPGTAIQNLSSIEDRGDIYISKQDSSGNLIWVKSFGGYSDDIGYSIAVDSAGNVFTTGNFWTIPDQDFDPGAGTILLPSEGNNDIFIIKLDTDGNVLWCKGLGGRFNDFGSSITVDKKGNLYATGSYMDTLHIFSNDNSYKLISVDGSEDIFVTKIDGAGNLIWAKSMGGNSADHGRGITTDSIGNVFITGDFSAIADFDPDNGIYQLNSSGDYDVFTTKLDANGNFIWARNMGSNLIDHGQSITTDAQGYIYTTGNFSGTSDSWYFDHNVNQEIFISKMDPSGNPIWTQYLAGTSNWGSGNSIEVDLKGNIYSTGYFSGTVDFDPGAGILNFISPQGFPKMYVLKLNPSGDLVWANKYGDGAGKDLTLDKFDNIYITGGFEGIVDFDPGPGIYKLISQGIDDIFVLKLGPCIAPNAPSTSNVTICSGSSANLSANGIGILSWYNAPTGGSYLGSGTNYSTSVINNTINYYVQDSTCTASSSRSLVVVTVNPLPTVSISGKSTICKRESTILTANGASSYQWNTQSKAISETVNPLSSMSYSVEGTDDNGCKNTAIQLVQVYDLPNVSITGSTNVCEGSSEILIASGAKNYIWNTGSKSFSDTINPTFLTTYTVEGTDANGCSNTASISVTPTNCRPIIIPNLFTPNNDSINEFFYIENLPPFYHLEIYNRWGQLIYQSDNYKNDWNGNGVEDDIYYYWLTDSKSEVERKGWIEKISK